MLTSSAMFQSEYDRDSELKAFDDSKSGVKGLVDDGVTKIPRIFIHPNSNLPAESDLDGVGNKGTLRAQIIDQVRDACENWGFFQVVNHGIPTSVLEEMMDGIRGFHEQDTERKVSFVSNFELFHAPVATWNDTLACAMAPNPPDPKNCLQDIVVQYMKKGLGYTLFELLSEALGLDANHMKDMECAEGIFLLGHYYPVCPEPELTLGARKHTDTSFLSVLVQDQVGGLQVLHENQWIDLAPSLEQYIEHSIGKPLSVSVASAFGTSLLRSSRLYGPIKELLTEENPPKYKEATLRDHVAHLKGKRV
ncbi:hypothetical protein AAG906_035438 [Vitis piasezkii]